MFSSSPATSCLFSSRYIGSFFFLLFCLCVQCGRRVFRTRTASESHRVFPPDPKAPHPSQSHIQKPRPRPLAQKGTRRHGPNNQIPSDQTYTNTSISLSLWVHLSIYSVYSSTSPSLSLALSNSPGGFSSWAAGACRERRSRPVQRERKRDRRSGRRISLRVHVSMSSCIGTLVPGPVFLCPAGSPYMSIPNT